MAKWYVREIQTTQLEHPFSCLCNLGKTIQHFPFEHIKFEFIKQARITASALGTLAVNNFSTEFKKHGKQASLRKIAHAFVIPTSIFVTHLFLRCCFPKCPECYQKA